MKFFLRRFLFIYLIFAFLIWIVLAAEERMQKEKSLLKVIFWDIGQGDAILINYRNNFQILVDSGENGDKLLEKIEKEMPWGDRTVEIVIATHYDLDHIGGMEKIFENFEVKKFFDNGKKVFSTEVAQKVDQILEAKKIERLTAWEGSVINLDSDFNIKFYNPDPEDENNPEFSDQNDSSVVFRLDFGKNAFLFTGDISEAKEKDLIEDEEEIKVDFLKVAHHGSKYSSSSDFINQVEPSFAIISVGRNNRFGHPHRESLETLEKSGAKIFRTDQQGDIEVVCFNPNLNCQITSEK